MPLPALHETGLEPDQASGSSQVLAGNFADSEASSGAVSDPPRSSAESIVTPLLQSSISEALEAARLAWVRDADPDVLRKALLKLVRALMQKDDGSA